ncbi:hypothetical protein [Humibacter ginsenosidimutans]|uniref:hypothetical protein n=1 Tax=Humibacter ginsenosidimutans TaxID=2599293 RepID=UPI00349ED54C
MAWAGATTSAMWQALQQQGVFSVAPVVTGLANTASYNAYGAVSDKISFLSYYFPGAADTPDREEDDRLHHEGWRNT